MFSEGTADLRNTDREVPQDFQVKNEGQASQEEAPHTPLQPHMLRRPHGKSTRLPTTTDKQRTLQGENKTKTWA